MKKVKVRKNNYIKHKTIKKNNSRFVEIDYNTERTKTTEATMTKPSCKITKRRR